MSNLKHALSPADLLPYAEGAKLTGLEYLQKTINGEICAPPISKLMNFGLHEIEWGHAVFHGSPQFDAFNPAGTVHGGWYGAIMDSAMACAIMSKCAKGVTYTTLEYKVNITRVVPEGMVVAATASVSHFGRTTAVSEAVMRGLDDGKVYATGSTTCIVIGAKA